MNGHDAKSSTIGPMTYFLLNTILEPMDGPKKKRLIHDRENSKADHPDGKEHRHAAPG